MSDDFSQHPESIAEVRANRAADASLISPRETLIALLRDIDAGRSNPDALIICYRQKDGAAVETFYSASAPDLHTSLGLLAYVLTRLTTWNAR